MKFVLDASVALKWVLPEAETLDRLCAAYFPGIAVPKEEESHEELSLNL